MLLIPCVSIVMAVTSNCFYELYNPPASGPSRPYHCDCDCDCDCDAHRHFQFCSNEVSELQLASGLATDYYPQDCEIILDAIDDGDISVFIQLSMRIHDCTQLCSSVCLSDHFAHVHNSICSSHSDGNRKITLQSLAVCQQDLDGTMSAFTTHDL